ncbi:uncharacterized protein LOC134269420 [Saccostrea cucullata]|uniref:uncharacterized protein LOC134269420 n=1 Tax=Saccostrea cuccullata TaxID=36930 RepID=UPI002ED1E2BB
MSTVASHKPQHAQQPQQRVVRKEPQVKPINRYAPPDYMTLMYHPTPTLEDLGLTSYLDSPPSSPRTRSPARGEKRRILNQSESRQGVSYQHGMHQQMTFSTKNPTAVSANKQSSKIDTVSEAKTSTLNVTNQMSERHQANVTNQMSERHQANVTNQMSERHQANVTNQMSERHQANVTNQMSERHQANVTNQMSERHQANVTNQMSERHQAYVTNQISERHQAHLTNQMGEKHQTNLTNQMSERHQAVSHTQMNTYLATSVEPQRYVPSFAPKGWDQTPKSSKSLQGPASTESVINATSRSATFTAPISKSVTPPDVKSTNNKRPGSGSTLAENPEKRACNWSMIAEQYSTESRHSVNQDQRRDALYRRYNKDERQQTHATKRHQNHDAMQYQGHTDAPSSNQTFDQILAEQIARQAELKNKNHNQAPQTDTNVNEERRTCQPMTKSLPIVNMDDLFGGLSPYSCWNQSAPEDPRFS